MYIFKILLLFFLFFLTGCGSEDTKSQSEIPNYTSIIDNNFSYDNTTTWQKSNWANGTPFYNAWCPDQILFSNNTMQLTLEQTPCNGYSHASGEYRSYQTYGYGRYSVRMKASDINGTVTSFFTYTGASEGTRHDEIDIEILGKNTSKMQVNYWRDGVEHPTLIELGFDASLDFHTYSFTWLPSSISWHVDGELVHTEDGSNGALPSIEGKIMMNLWACTGVETWCGSYTDGTPAYAIYEFVRFEELQ